MTRKDKKYERQLRVIPNNTRIGPMIDRERLERVVREAGQIALGYWPGHGHALDSWEKDPGSPVSAADLAVDAFLKRELAGLLPAAGWLSEETVDAPDRLAGGLIWLVDPIDGTRDFIRGRSGWAVSVALISAGRPLIGMLDAPARGEFWHGEAGRGAWRNGARLNASRRTELTGARVPAQVLPRIILGPAPVRAARPRPDRWAWSGRGPRPPQRPRSDRRRWPWR